MRLLLLCLAVLAVSGSTRSRDLSFFHLPLRVPYVLDVVLVGFAGDGQLRYEVETRALEELLESTLPVRHVHDLESGARLLLRYAMEYRVRHVRDLSLRSDVMTRYRELLLQGLAKGRVDPQGLPLVEAASLEPAFRDALEEMRAAHPGKVSHTVFLLNPDMAGQRYAVVEGRSAPSQAWVAGGRYVVFDAAASACSHGSTRSTGSSLSHASLPRVPNMVEATLHHVVVSAVEHVLLPDLLDVRHSQPADMVLIPLLHFHNHEAFVNVPEGSQASFDETRVERELASLSLPGVSTRFVIGSHSLHDHSEVAMALSQSTRARTEHAALADGRYELRFVHEVGGADLLEHLATSSDDLTYRVLDASDSNSRDTEAIKRAYFPEDTPKRASNLRIFPIYILSLLGKPKGFLFERGAPLFASARGAALLHTNWTDLETPYHEEGRVHLLDQRSSLTQHIIEAVVRGLANVSPPHLKWSAVHNATRADYLWSVGATTGSPLCESTRVSQITRDNAIHAAVISRVDDALRVAQQVLHDVRHFENLFVWTPGGSIVDDSHASDSLILAISALLDRLQPLRDTLTSVANAYDSNDRSLALDLANTLPTTAEQLAADARDALLQLKTDLFCCNMRHLMFRSVPLTSYGLLLILLVSILISVLSVIGTRRRSQLLLPLENRV